MNAIQVGSEWKLNDVRYSGHRQGSIAVVASVSKNHVSYTYNGDDAGTRCTLSHDEFLAVFHKVKPRPASWDYEEADRLYEAAVAAIKAYNEYVERKPQTSYLPMIESTGRYQHG